MAWCLTGSANNIIKVHFHTAEWMSEIDNEAAQLAVANPQFTNDVDGRTLDKNDYLKFLQRVFCELIRVLNPGGILVCVNTDLRDHARYNRGDRRFNGLVWQKHGDIRTTAERVGFRCIDTKIWSKSLHRSLYRYSFAYIQFFQKPGRGRNHSCRYRVHSSFAPDVWLLERGTHRKDSRGSIFLDAMHPEIALRCIHQFTSIGDLVVSPFAGSGTVLSVANLMRRCCVGYEINKNLLPLIKESVTAPEHFSAYFRCLQPNHVCP